MQSLETITAVRHSAGDSNNHNALETQCVHALLRSLHSFVSIMSFALPARRVILDHTFDPRPLQI